MNPDYMFRYFIGGLVAAVLVAQFLIDLFVKKKTYVVVMTQQKEQKDGWTTIHPLPYHTYVVHMRSERDIMVEIEHSHKQYLTDDWVITIKRVPRWESLNK